MQAAVYINSSAEAAGALTNNGSGVLGWLSLGSIGGGGITYGYISNYAGIGTNLTLYGDTTLAGTTEGSMVFYGSNAVNYVKLTVHPSIVSNQTLRLPTNSLPGFLYSTVVQDDTNQIVVKTHQEVDPPGLLFGNQLTYTNIYLGNLDVGNIDLYTVPAGLRALVTRLVCSTTNDAGSTVFWTSKTNSVYYRLSANSALTTSSSTDIAGNTFIYEGSETIAISNSAVGVNVFLGFYLYTNTVPALTKRVYSLPTGTNTLYTVAAGKTAWTVTLTGLPTAQPGIFAMNDSALSQTMPWYVVPNGGALSTTNRLAVVTFADKALGTRTPPMLRGGDSIVLVGTNAATVTAWMTVFEQ